MGTVRLGKRTEGRSPLIKDFVPLADLDDLVFGGWDIFEDDCYEAAKTAGVLERTLLDEIKGATQRAVGVTRQLLAVGHKNPVQASVLDLNAAVSALGGMLQRLIGKDVLLEVRSAPVPALVNADPGLIDQVLLNLAVNARGAMPAGGQLTIGVTVVNRHADSFACISVTDTGSGIAAEHLPHIFEPFFTTKEKGEGTGLGLATSYAVVQQHGGRIDVETEVGRGSTFRVYLPLDRSAE